MSAAESEFVIPAFGPRGVIPTAAKGWWAARAINDRGEVSLLHDRQATGGSAMELLETLNDGLLRALKGHITRLWKSGALRGEAHAALDLPPGMGGSVRAAGGYYYLAVWSLDESST